MGLRRGSLTLPRMNAHRLVIIAATLTTVVAAALATALATFSGQALPRAVHQDLGWSYDFPTRDLLPIAGMIAFYNEKVDIVLDGQRLERPETHFFTSRRA